MRRSSIITRFAIEAGYMDEKSSKVLIRDYQKSPESSNLTFESWAITKGHLKIEQAKSLLVTIAASRFMCTSCGNGFLGNELIGGTEYRCPNCNGEDFLLQSKAKAADNKVSKAPKLLTPPEGVDKNSLEQQNITTSDSIVRHINDTTGLGSHLTDSVIESDEERAKREIEQIENESQKALKKAAFSKYPEKKLDNGDNTKTVEFTAEMMDRGLPPGAILDGVKIEKIIGRGGIGIVYKAMDLTLERPVALKVLNSEVLSDKAQVERFGIEARSMAQLEHPNVVSVYKFGEKFGRPYLSMQWIDGENIGQKIDKQGALPLTDCLYWFIQTARGLLEAHNHGIIHRDIKPDNIIVNSKGRVKIVDFGLAKQVVKAEHIGLSDPRFVLGTPAYIAPEQALGEEIDNRTDIYSFAISIFHALTGKLPFTGSPAAVVHQHISTPLPYVKEYVASVPDELNRLIKVMSSKNMENRPNDMAEIVSKLEQILFDHDPEYAGRVNIAPKYDSIMMNNKKILADSNQILAVFDETEEDGTFTAAQEAQKIRQHMNDQASILDNDDSNDNLLDGPDLFDEIQNADIFNTQSDFTTNEIAMFTPGESSKKIDPRINDEIKKIQDEMDKADNLSDSSDNLFDSNFDAFDDLQVEILESERSEEIKDFEDIKDQLKQQSIEDDDDEDDIKPLEEVEYTENSDVVLADEDDILITGKLQADAIRRKRKQITEKRRRDESDGDEDDDDEDLPEKIKLQVSQSFASRAHRDEDENKPGQATISQEEAERLMAQHKKAKSPRTIKVTRVIPIASTFIIVFILAFTLFLALTTNTKNNGVKTNNTKLKAEHQTLINKAQTDIAEKNGTSGKYTLSSMNKFMEKNKDFEVNADFLHTKAELEEMIRNYERDKRWKDGKDLKDLDYKNFSVVRAKQHLDDIQNYIDSNPKLASEFKLEKLKTDINKYLIVREKKEAEEEQISEFIKVFNDVDTTDLEQLYDVKQQLNNLLGMLPDYKNDQRLVDISNKITAYIDKTDEKKALNKILKDFDDIHKKYRDADANEWIKKLEDFLKDHKMFRRDQEVIDKLKDADEKIKLEDKWLKDLKEAYVKWQSAKSAERSKMTKDLLNLYKERMAIVPRIKNDAAIELQFVQLRSELKINEDDQATLNGFRDEAEKMTSIEEIDSLLEKINKFLESRDYLQFSIDETISKLKTKRAEFVLRAEEEKIADGYSVKVDELINKLKYDKNYVSEGEKLMNEIKDKIENELTFTEKFEALVDKLEKTLRHERLVTQADFNGFAWQAEKINISDKNYEMNQFSYSYNIGHSSEITVITVDPKKEYLLTCDITGDVKVYLHKTLEEIRSFRIPGRILDAVYTDKAEYVVFSLESGNVELWNIALREKVSVVGQFEQPIYCLAYYKQTLFCAGGNTNVVQISLDKFSETKESHKFDVIRTLKDPRGVIRKLAISPDQKYLSAGCEDSYVYVWSIENPESDNFRLHHSSSITSVSFSENSMFLLTTSDDGKASIWSVKTRSLSREFRPMITKTYRTGVYLGADKVVLLADNIKSFSKEGIIEVANIESKRSDIKIDTTSEDCSFMKVIKVDGVRYLYVAKKDGSIFSYKEIEDDQWKVRFKTDFIVDSALVTDNDKVKLFSIYKSGKLQLSDLNGVVEYTSFLEHYKITCASISGTAKTAVIGTSDGKLIYYDISTRKFNVPERSQFTTEITSVSMKNDGSKVLVGLDDKRAFIYDANGRKDKNLIGLNGSTIFTAINSIDSVAIYGILSGFFTPITLPAGVKDKDINITCNYVTYVGFNRIDDEGKEDILFIGYRDRSNKGVLVEFSTQTWNRKELITGLNNSIINVTEISKSKIYVSFENGEIASYKHNLYDYNDNEQIKMEKDGTLSLTDLSDRVHKVFVANNMIYILTVRGTIIALSEKTE